MQRNTDCQHRIFPLTFVNFPYLIVWHMVEIVVRLVGEAEDRLFELFVGEQISRVDLKKEIERVTQIPLEFQRIEFRGKKLSVVNCPIQDINYGEEIVVKHSLLGNYTTFVNCLESAQKAMASNMAVESEVDAASRHLKPLIECNFFVTYPSCDKTRQTFKDQFSFYLDTEFKYIEIASKHYFSIIYGENPACPTLEIKCVQKRRSGVQGGLECHIHQNGKLTNIYHVKIHTRLAKWHDNKSCDLRELFAYKLLEFINVGPKVHFFPNMHYSGFGLYIASEDIFGFRREAEIVEENPTRMAQLELLSCCLFLSDLKSNDENYGADDQEQLKIVDFEIGGHGNSSEVVARRYFSRHTQFRIDVGKASFSSWDLLKNIDVANTAIEDQKKLLEKHSITFKSDRILDDYLTNIKNNVIAIAHYFE